MNSYFYSFGKDLASKIEIVPNPIATGKCNLNPHNKQFIYKAIGVQNIRKAMVKIKASQTFGSDKVSSYFLKLAIPFVERSLALILLSKLATLLTRGKMLALHRFVRMEIKLQNLITAQCQFSLYFQRYLRRLCLTSYGSIYLKMI